MTRPAPIITGGREPSPAPAQRPGRIPSCCGALHALNGGHHAGDYASEPCAFRPNRCFDHLDAGQDEQLSATAHQMRRSIWWYAWVGREEQHEALRAVVGEIEVRS